MVVPRMLPYVNFVLATSSLVVQLAILVPWHNVLDTSFDALRSGTKQILADHREDHDRQLGRIEKHLGGLVERLEAGGAKVQPLAPK